MKILLLTSKLNFKTAGGSVVDLHLKAKELASLGHEVSVVTAFSHINVIDAPLPYHVIEEQVPYRGLLGIQWGGYGILKRHAGNFDVAYLDGQIFLYAGGLYRLCGGKTPIIGFFNTRISCMGTTQDNPVLSEISLRKRLKIRLRFLIEKFIGVPIANHMDAFIFTTPMVERIFLDFGFRKTKANVIPDSSDMAAITERHHISPEHIKERQDASPPITFIASGRMIKEKGFELIVRAFASLDSLPEYRVILSGGGPDKERLEALVSELGLASKFVFPGWVEREELERMLATAQVFIFPKWWIEYTSVLLLEVFAFGLPCIIPKGGGLEWLSDSKAATFTADDVSSLATAIKALAQSKEDRIRIGNAMLARGEVLDAKPLALQLEALCKKVISKKN